MSLTVPIPRGTLHNHRYPPCFGTTHGSHLSTGRLIDLIVLGSVSERITTIARNYAERFTISGIHVIRACRSPCWGNSWRSTLEGSIHQHSWAVVVAYRKYHPIRVPAVYLLKRSHRAAIQRLRAFIHGCSAFLHLCHLPVYFVWLDLVVVLESSE